MRRSFNVLLLFTNFRTNLTLPNKLTGDYKRVRGSGYSFVIPKEWVADTFIELAKAQRMAGQLDYKMKRMGGGTLPDAGA